MNLPLKKFGSMDQLFQSKEKGNYKEKKKNVPRPVQHLRLKNNK